MQNCVAYSANKTCTACADGFRLASATSCVAITITNCLQSDTAGAVCYSCKNTKKPSADGKTCSDTACTDTNCTTCAVTSSIEVCSVCKSGFALSTSTGNCVAQVTANCAVQNATQCTFCKVGYYFKDNTCL